MECIKVGNLMTPISLYPTVSAESSLYESVLALKQARVQISRKYEKPNAVLVIDDSYDIVGRIGFRDLLKAIEPKYFGFGYPRELTDRECCGGCNFAGSIQRTYGLWREALREICSKVPEIKAGEIMKPLKAGERISEDASLEEALNNLILGGRDSLFVMRGNMVVGVLSLSNVVEEISGRIEACRLPVSEKDRDELAA